MTAIALPRWVVYAMASALIAASAFSFGAVYTARGDNHETTFYACLFAGSLSQVNTNDFPANCGRGEPVSWNAVGVQGPAGTSNAYFTFELEDFLFLDGFPFGEPPTVVGSQLVPAGEYVTSAVVAVANTSGIARFVACQLAGGSAGGLTIIRLAPVDEPGDSTVLTLQNSYSFGSDDVIEVRCGEVTGGQPPFANLLVLQLRITTIEVAQVN